MSYSFNFRAPNKTEAKAIASQKMEEVAQQQRAHEADKAQVIAAAHAFIDLLPEDDTGREVAVSMNGYVSGAWEGSDLLALSAVSASVSASWVAPQ